MPFHINLLHEEQSKDVQRNRDPLKIGLLGLLVIAFCFYGYYLIRSIGAGKVAAERAGLKTELAKLAPEATASKLQESAAKLTLSSTATVEKIINSRFYWGPLLSEIVASTGPEIQFVSFDGAVRAENAIDFTVVGVAAGREPRAVAERFRQSMGDRLGKNYGTVVAQFVSLENSETPLLISGKSFATANFTISFQITLTAK